MIFLDNTTLLGSHSRFTVLIPEGYIHIYIYIYIPAHIHTHIYICVFGHLFADLFAWFPLLELLLIQSNMIDCFAQKKHQVWGVLFWWS